MCKATSEEKNRKNILGYMYNVLLYCKVLPRQHSGQGAVLQFGRSLVRSQLVSFEFFIDIESFRSHYGPGVDSASNRNEYQDYFLGVKSGRYVRLTTLPPSCAVVTKSGNLNFLEPCGPLQTYNGTALPLLHCKSGDLRPIAVLLFRLTFSHHTSYILDRRTATHHNALFIYLVNKYI